MPRAGGGGLGEMSSEYRAFCEERSDEHVVKLSTTFGHAKHHQFVHL